MGSSWELAILGSGWASPTHRKRRLHRHHCRQSSKVLFCEPEMEEERFLRWDGGGGVSGRRISRGLGAEWRETVDGVEGLVVVFGEEVEGLLLRRVMVVVWESHHQGFFFCVRVNDANFAFLQWPFIYFPWKIASKLKEGVLFLNCTDFLVASLSTFLVAFFFHFFN